MVKKKLDLGEYVITIEYDKQNGKLDVKVLDEGGELIEGILISEDDDDELDISAGIDFNLN